MVAVRVRERSAVADTRVERVHRELDVLLLERSVLLGDVRHAQCQHAAELRERDRQVAGLVLDPLLPRRVRVAREPERLAVERVRPSQVFDRDRDEVDAPGVEDQPTEPSIWSWIRRFISTAYSSGSSFVIGSTKPDTTIADASASDRPRDMR